MIPGVHLVIQLAERYVVIGKAGIGAEDRRGVTVRQRALRGGQLRRARLGKLRRAGVADRVDLPRTIVGEEVEKPVLADRAAYAAAELLLLVHRLRVIAGGLLDRVEGVQCRIAQIVEEVAMQEVRAGLGYGIDDAAGSLPQLRAV